MASVLTLVAPFWVQKIAAVKYYLQIKSGLSISNRC